MKTHPVYELLNKADLTETERVALYGVMHLSTFEGWSDFTVEQVWDKMVAEYEAIKTMAAIEGVPQDNPTESDPRIKADREQRINNLLMMPSPSKLKN